MPRSAAPHRPRLRRFEAAMRNAAAVAWTGLAAPPDGVIVDMDSTSLVHETELKQQPDCGHDGYGEKPLRDSCDDIDFVHDVLRSVGGSDEEHIAPRADLQQTQCLTVC